MKVDNFYKALAISRIVIYLHEEHGMAWKEAIEKVKSDILGN